MMYILDYYIFDGERWLSDDEHSWTADFSAACSFVTHDLANNIAARECGDKVYYIMGCASSETPTYED